jgi:hypothetical protein
MGRRRRSPTEMEKLGEMEALRRLRDSYPLPRKVSDLFQTSGMLKPEYAEHRPARRAIEAYHQRNNVRVAEYKVDLGVRQALKLPLLHQQLVHREPWAVYWLANGRRYKKRFTSLGAAIEFHARVIQQVPNATIISRSRGYHIPPSLRGKLPKGWVWCPHCMKPRKYRRHPSGETFSVFKKDPVTFQRKLRDVALLICPMCQNTNRDHVYRASNQPWEIRKFKRGATRARKGVRGEPYPKKRRRR